MPSLLTLATSALALATSSSLAFPLQPRVVGTVTCSAFSFTNTNTTGLFVNETGLSKIVELGLEADGVTIGQEEKGEEGSFGFEVCESAFMRSVNTNTFLVGHATYTAANGSSFCLTTTYPYKGQTPYLEPCFYSDDSRQFLQWWGLDLAPNGIYFASTSAPDTTTQVNLLEFLGPSIVANNDPLYPNEDDLSTSGNLTLEAEPTPADAEDYAYFFFDAPATATVV